MKYESKREVVEGEERWVGGGIKAGERGEHSSGAV